MAIDRAGLQCSFCGKTQRQVRRLIAGPGGVFVCSECIALCNVIIEQEEAPPEREPDTVPAARRKYRFISIEPDLVEVIDDLLDAHVEDNPADAANWLIRAGAEARQELLAEAHTAAEEVRRLRSELPGSPDPTLPTIEHKIRSRLERIATTPAEDPQ